MIQVTPQMRILVTVAAVDFRAGIDGLCGICRRVLKEDPFRGQVFIFRNRRGSALKILTVRVSGFAKNGCRPDASSGGRKDKTAR